MRPDRAVVKKAIQDAEGNLSRAAVLLGCTRQTLYTWIYQHGLDRLAGIRPHTQAELDKSRRMDRSGTSKDGLDVQSAQASRATFRVMEALQTADPIVPATVKIRESLWKRLKIRAIEDDTTMGAIVERALELVLEPRQRKVSGAKQQQ
jgi:transposase-like protein